MDRFKMYPVHEPEPGDDLEPMTITADQVAMYIINGAFRSIGRKLNFVDDAIYALRIRDAVREGKGSPEDIAWRALELEGWQPKWVDAGEISYIGLDAYQSPGPAH